MNDRIERMTEDAWKSVLGSAPQDVTGDFFMEGGDSIKALRLVGRLSESLGARVPLSVVMSAPTTFAGVCERLAALASDGGLRAASDPLPVGSPVAMSANQRYRLTLDARHRDATGESVQDTAGGIWKVPSSLDPDTVRRAAIMVASKHVSLRQRFRDGAATVVDEAAMAFDVARPTGDDAESSALTEANRHVTTSFDRDEGPMWGIRLSLVGQELTVLSVAVDHLVCDHSSLQLIMDELCSAYDALNRGQDAPFKAPQHTVFDWIQWEFEHTRPTNLELAVQKMPWAGSPALPSVKLSLETPVPDCRQATMGTEIRTVGVEQVAALEALANANRTGLSQVVLTAYVRAISEFTTRPVAGVLIPFANRALGGVADIVGWIANLAAVGTPVSPGETFTASLDGVSKGYVEAEGYSHIPLRALLERFPPPSLGDGPPRLLYFNYLDASIEDRMINGARMVPCEIRMQRRLMPGISLHVTRTVRGTVELRAVHELPRLTSDSMDLILRRLSSHLEGAIHEAKTSIGR